MDVGRAGRLFWTGLTLIFAGAEPSRAEIYLTPAPVEAGEAPALRLQHGAPGGAAVTPDRLARTRDAARAATAVEWYFERTLGRQANRDFAPSGADGVIRPGAVEAVDGLRIVGVDSQPSVREIPREELAPLAAAAGVRLPGTAPSFKVQILDSAKTIVRERAGSGPSEVAFSKSGQRAEIRPFADPTVAPVGGDIPFVVYVDGIKRGEIPVTARHADGSPAVVLDTSDPAKSYLRLSRAGEWHLAFARLSEAEPGAGFEYRLHTATLVFVADARGGTH